MADNNITSSELFDTPLTVPTNKLDADQYSADDLDGVTESVFGSGNLGFASLQASQTDSMLAANNTMDFVSDAPTEQTSRSPNFNDASLSDTDRPLDSGENMAGNNMVTDGNNTNTTIGSLGASTLSSDNNTFTAPATQNTESYDFGGSSSSSATSTSSSSSSTTTSSDGSTTTVNNTQHNTTTTTNNYHEGDHIENTETLINVDTDILDVTNVTDILNTQITNLTETITSTLTTVTDLTTVITENLFETINNLLDGEISLDLTLDVLDTLGADLGIIIEDGITGNSNIDLVTDNLSTITNDLTGLDLPLVSNTTLDVGFDLLGNSGADSSDDLVINGLDALGIPEIGINLDPLEDIVGDIDITLSTDTEFLTNPEALIDDLGDLSLAGIDEALTTIGDQTIEGALEAVVGDTLLDEAFDVGLDEVVDMVTDPVEDVLNDLTDTLIAGDENGIGDVIEDIVDPVEDLISDITEPLLSGDGDTEDILTDAINDILNIENDIDLLSSNTESDGNNSSDEGAEDTNWTESIINETTGLFDDLTDGLNGDGEDILPEPSGTIAEGIGVLDIDPELDTGSLGGLFG
jgi:flagellar hook-basal body complex protein FliE